MGKSIASVAVRSLAGIGFFLLVFFLPAGTWDYWQAWVFLAVITGGLVAAVCYLFGRNPALLERRLKTREARPEQRLIILLSLPVLLAAFIVPGFDRRYGWSRVPVWVSVLAFLCIIGAFYFYFLVMRANQFAGRTIEVAEGQHVISTGPYALVRHPMYLAVMSFYLLSPLALGSWWALLPAALIVPVLAARIITEEKALARDLPGYREYLLKTRYRLLPGIW